MRRAAHNRLHRPGFDNPRLCQIAGHQRVCMKWLVEFWVEAGEEGHGFGEIVFTHEALEVGE